MKKPYDSFYWQLRDLQRTLDLLSSQIQANTQLPPGLLDQIDQFRKLEERFTLPAAHLRAIDDVAARFKASQFEALTEIAKLEPAFLEHVRGSEGSLSSITSQLSNLPDELLRPFDKLAESLVPIEAVLSSGRIAKQLAEAALRPFGAFEQFAEEQRRLIDSATAEIERVHRLSFLDSAADLLGAATQASELALLMGEGVDVQEPPSAWDLNLFTSLSSSAERYSFDDEDFSPDEFVQQSCESRVAELGQRLVRLVFDLNTEAEREGKEALFKPTNRGLFACMVIPTRIATEDGSFGIVIDHLYFLLYEGSGAAKRLTSQATDEALAALWRLKHLRLGARHDLDHGSDAQASNKAVTVGEAFKRLIGTTVPKSAAEWCEAQKALYEELIEMLERIWFGDDDGNDSEPGASS